MTRVARLRYRLIFEQPTFTIDEGGGQGKGQYTAYGERWGEMKAASGRNIYVAEQLKTQVDQMVTVRADKGITANMRIRLEDGRLLRITYLDAPGPTQEFMDIMTVWDKARTEQKDGEV